MTWTYNGDLFTEENVDNHVGFVYLITNMTNGKKYVGKKLFTKSKTYQKNKKKKRKRVSSDWQDYTGSNEQLNEDIQHKNVIKKEILHLCRSKGECSYLEAKEQFEREVLLRDDYYNSIINCRINRNHLRNMMNAKTRL